jgi:hypothetical protein
LTIASVVGFSYVYSRERASCLTAAIRVAETLVPAASRSIRSSRLATSKGYVRRVLSVDARPPCRHEEYFVDG